MIRNLTLALLTGLGITLYVMQEDPWIQNLIARAYARSFAQSMGCTFTYKRVKRVNVFIPILELEDITVGPEDGAQWKWRAKTYTTNCSWLHVLLHGMIDMYIAIDGMRAQTSVSQGELAIAGHLEKMALGPSLIMPIFLKSLTINDGQVVVDDTGVGYQGVFNWQSESRKIDRVWRSNYQIIDGTVTMNNEPVVQRVQAEVDCDIYNFYSDDAMRLRCSGSVQLPQLSGTNKTCYLAGSWKHGSGSMSIKHPDGDIAVDPVRLVRTKNNHILVDGTIKVPLAYVWRLSGGLGAQEMGGTCKLRARAYLDDLSQGVHGQYAIKNITYNTYPIISDISGSMTRNDAVWRGRLVAHVNEQTAFNGTWKWQEQQACGSLKVGNSQEIPVIGFEHWALLPHNTNITCVFDHKHNVSCSYQARATHTKTHDTVHTRGKVVAQSDAVCAIGTMNNRRYTLEGILQPHVRLTRVLYADERNRPLLTFNADDSDYNRFEGLVQFPFIRSLLFDALGYDVQGDGHFKIEGMVGEENIQAQVSLLDGNIRLPETYNFINGFTAQIDANSVQRMASVSNMKCMLHKGSISCSRAVVHFNDAYKPTFAHAPIIIDSCLLNMKRDFFAIVSGALTLHKQEDSMPLLKGTVMVERAQLKENLFSGAFQQDLFSFTRNAFDIKSADVACDVAIVSKHPIRVNTAFLETNAKVNVHIKNTIREPEVSGSVELLSGALHFPYRSLHISKGNIFCSPHQLHDPHIELVAKNTVKKYDIRMHVTGSLKDHHVLLESTPPLTEEQIVSLLLVGSHEESLNMVMPALIMQNVTNIVFESDQSPLKLSEHFNSLLTPFKYIHLVPSFSDQSGRGGLRGAVEIDVSDRWNVLIQKNFSLSEDTRFELEYLLSDDISLRGVRDERKDISAEVEMRWKF